MNQERQRQIASMGGKAFRTRNAVSRRTGGWRRRPDVRAARASPARSVVSRRIASSPRWRAVKAARACRTRSVASRRIQSSPRRRAARVDKPATVVAPTAVGARLITRRLRNAPFRADPTRSSASDDSLAGLQGRGPNAVGPSGFPVWPTVAPRGHANFASGIAEVTDALELEVSRHHCLPSFRSMIFPIS